MPSTTISLKSPYDAPPGYIDFTTFGRLSGVGLAAVHRMVKSGALPCLKRGPLRRYINEKYVKQIGFIVDHYKMQRHGRNGYKQKKEREYQ